MIKAIIFDIDDTLYSYKRAHEIAFARMCDYAEQTLGLPAQTMAADYQAEAQAMKAYVGGQAAIHNRLIRFQRILERRKLSLSQARVLDCLYWNTLIAAAELEPGCREALEGLKQAGYILGVGTNMTLDWQLVKLEKLGLLPLMSFVVSSEEAGVEKPDARLFALCAQKAGVRPEECLFVGDSLKSDVLGAENAGMQALWYAPEQTDFAKHPGFSHFSHLQKLVPMG